MKNVLKPLAKSVLIPLESITAASAADARIHKKSLRIRDASFRLSKVNNINNFR